MDESNSKSRNNKQNNISSNIVLSTGNIIEGPSNKENHLHPVPIYIYDAPNDLGLPILQAIFQIVINPFQPSNIYSAYILPDNLNRIFFEASDLKSVRRTLRYISGIKSIPKNLPVIRGDQINQFFINPVGCLHFHPGQIVTMHNPEFDNQYGQIVDIKKETGNILIKTYPHIDYEFLRTHKNFTTQSQVNESMDPSYKAPMVPFNKENLITTNSSIPIWNSQVNGIKWDNKFFIGKFQYVWINYKEIAHKKSNELTAEERRIFLEGISDYEKMNHSFIKGFYGQLNFEGTHESESVLQLSLNKGMPSWAHKKSQGANFSSDSSSDSDVGKNSNNYSKSQNPRISTKNSSDSDKQIQFSQNRNFVSEDSDLPPPLPDFDDDDENDDKNEFKIHKQNKIINSPVFVGSTSTESENENKNSNKNDKSNSKIDKYHDIFSSSDSDIDALFNRTTSTENNKKSKQNKNQNSSSQKDHNESKSKSKNEKLKLKKDKSSKSSEKSKQKHSSTLFSSDSESQKHSNHKSQNKPIKSLLDSSDSSSDFEFLKTSSKKNISNSSNSDSDVLKKPKKESSYSSSDVEIIEPSKEKMKKEIEKKKKEFEKKKKEEKEGNKKMINKLFKESLDFGNSPPSEKVYFGYASDSDSEDQGIKFEPKIDKDMILEEQSQQISKKRMRRYYKKKGLPIPEKYLSDSYSFDSDSSS